MKKIITLILTIFITFSLFGCSSVETPTNVTKNYIESLKKEGAKQMLEKALDGTLDNFKGNEALVTMFGTMLLDFDYDISNEQIIDNSNATVDVEFKTYNYVDFIKNFLSDYIGQALSMAMSGKTEEELTNFASDLIKEKLEETKTLGKTSVANITIELEKVEGKWAIKEASNKEISSALLGGLKEMLEELSHKLIN